MKKVLSLILAISMVMSMFTFSFAGTELRDVAGTEYQSAVEALVELGIVNGYEDGTYKPGAVVTRAEMAKLLVVAAGLEKAAELNEGATRFSDVNGGWASGYINVAAEYGYIVGDPEGTFRPNDTVSYAEAATMALRVLGYKSVIESKGTWPTNYISWAEELEMLDNVEYKTYKDGATRGNVAILIWNMLRTNMWNINGESEGDGLQYGKSDPMLNTKFPNYKYSVATFKDFDINADAEVIVTLSTAKDSKVALNGDYEYLKNDFYTFVEGTEVEVLVNTKDETILSMVRTDSKKVVEGTKDEIDADYKALHDKIFVYGYGLVDGKEITNYNLINAENLYVYEVNTSNKNYVKFNDKVKKNYDEMEKFLFLKDGERASIKDVEEGDVLSKVTVTFKDDTDEVFYVIGSSEIEGTLTKIVLTPFEENAKKYPVATIDGEEYVIDAGALYFEDPEDMNDSNPFGQNWNTDMKGEEVTAVLDYFGRVAAVLFDGKIDAGKDSATTDVRFYGSTWGVEKDGRTYVLPVVDVDGEDELTFVKNAGAQYQNPNTNLEGVFTVVSLDKDGNIEALADATGKQFMISYRESGELTDNETTTLKYGEERNEYYVVTEFEAATYDKDKKTVGGIKVGASTIVVTLGLDDKGTDRTTDDEYTVTFEEGISSIERMKGEPALVITDNTTKLGKALYVIVFDEMSTRGEDELVGIVADVSENEIGETLITVDDVRLTASEIKTAKKDAMILSKDSNVKNLVKDEVIIYSTEVNKNDETEIIVLARLTAEELKVTETRHGYVPNKDQSGEISENGREALVVAVAGEEARVVDLDSELEFGGNTLDFSDFRFILVDVELDDKDDTETQYYPTAVKDVDFEDVQFKFLDRISMDPSEEVVIIIRGMDKRTATTTPEEGNGN